LVPGSHAVILMEQVNNEYVPRKLVEAI
jgi:hypothetical protein